MSNIQSSKNVRRVLTYPENMEKLALYKAHKRGLPSIQSYIQFLIAKDLEDILDEVDILTDAENAKVGESLEQIKSGNYVDLTTPQEILDYFRKLD